MTVTLNIMYNATIQNELRNYIRYGNIIEDNSYYTRDNHCYRFMVVEYENHNYDIEMIDGEFTRVEIMMD